eukprot:scaffold65454_cov31-Tisochrysis_lutea.AAC.1
MRDESWVSYYKVKRRRVWSHHERQSPKPIPDGATNPSRMGLAPVGRLPTCCGNTDAHLAFGVFSAHCAVSHVQHRALSSAKPVRQEHGPDCATPPHS